MIKRRAVAPGLPGHDGCHTLPATGITEYLANGWDTGSTRNGWEPSTSSRFGLASDRRAVDEISMVQSPGAAHGPPREVGYAMSTERGSTNRSPAG